MIWAVSLSRMEFIPHTLTPELKRIGLRSLPDVGNLVGPLSQTVALRPKRTNSRLYLNIFRREPDISELV